MIHPLIIIKSLRIIGAITILMSCGANVSADCIDPVRDEAFRRSDLVFAGELIRFVPATNAYTFRVSQVLKGEPHPQVVVFENDFGVVEFSYSFVPDTKYLVFAENKAGRFVTGGCRGNVVLGITAEARRQLRADFEAKPPDYLLLLFALGGLLCHVEWIWSKISSRPASKDP